MTKEEILQKVNDYCGERSYTEETLTSEFKDNFAEHFVKGRENDELSDADTNTINFSMDTAFNAASKSITAKSNTFLEKEKDLMKQIEELKKTPKKAEGDEPKADDKSEEMQKTINELLAYKKQSEMNDKRNAVLREAKRKLNNSEYYSSFEKFFEKVDVTLDGDDAEQAKTAVDDFWYITKDMIGGRKPLAPSNGLSGAAEAMLGSVKKVTI